MDKVQRAQMTVPRSHRPRCALPDATPYGLRDTIEDMIRVCVGGAVCGRKLGGRLCLVRVKFGMLCLARHFCPENPNRYAARHFSHVSRMSWRFSHPAPPCREHQTKIFAQGPDWRDRAVLLMSSRAHAEALLRIPTR